jgi:hypothetical protein
MKKYDVLGLLKNDELTIEFKEFFSYLDVDELSCFEDDDALIDLLGEEPFFLLRFSVTNEDLNISFYFDHVVLCENLCEQEEKNKNKKKLIVMDNFVLRHLFVRIGVDCLPEVTKRTRTVIANYIYKKSDELKSFDYSHYMEKFLDIVYEYEYDGCLSIFKMFRLGELEVSFNHSATIEEYDGKNQPYEIALIYDIKNKKQDIIFTLINYFELGEPTPYLRVDKKEIFAKNKDNTLVYSYSEFSSCLCPVEEEEEIFEYMFANCKILLNMDYKALLKDMVKLEKKMFEYEEDCFVHEDESFTDNGIEFIKNETENHTPMFLLIIAVVSSAVWLIKFIIQSIF